MRLRKQYPYAGVIYNELYEILTSDEYEDDGEDTKIDENKSKQLEQRKQDNFEKTRKCVITHSELFSGYKPNQINNGVKEGKGTKRKSLLPKIGSKSGPPNKRQKLNNQGVKRGKRSDKMENDEDDDIIDNDAARRFG